MRGLICYVFMNYSDLLVPLFAPAMSIKTRKVYFFKCFCIKDRNVDLGLGCGGTEENKEEEMGSWNDRTERRAWLPWGQKTEGSEDRQRKMKEGGVAFGEYCNLKATKWLHKGPADEIWQKEVGDDEERPLGVDGRLLKRCFRFTSHWYCCVHSAKVCLYKFPHLSCFSVSAHGLFPSPSSPRTQV